MKNLARASAIAQILLAGNTPLSARSIAEKLGVSSKTVLRELPKLARMASDRDLVLKRKTGTGISIVGDAEKQKAFLAQLKANAPVGFTAQERLTILAGQLLKNSEPIKLFTLAKQLNVTDGTVSNDLDKLETWFREHGLMLVRRPGLGVYVEGDERAIRRALISILYENLDEEHLLRLVREDETADKRTASGHLLSLVDAEVVRRIEGFVHEMESDLPHHFSDHAFIGLVVHLTLAVERMRKQEGIHIEPDILADLRSRSAYPLAEKLARRIEKAFSLAVPAGEIGYITMHLLGARSRYIGKQDRDAPRVGNFRLVQLARAIIRRMEEQTGKPLLQNRSLLMGLVNHLGPSVSRLTMHMTIRNPLLEEMQQMYPHYMAMARVAAEPLENELGVTLPDAEVAYIAMHLGAALVDADTPAHKTIRVLVACPTGVGTSRLLASSVRRAFPNLYVVDTVSTIHITEASEESGASFVISTVPIPNAPLPVIVTGLLLDEAGRARIAEAIQRAERYVLPCKKGCTQKPAFSDGLPKMIAYGTAIRSLLEGFFVRRIAEHVSDAKRLCMIAAEQICTDRTARDSIMDAFLQRESKGSTIIKGHGIMVLHARTKASHAPRVGVLRLSAPFVSESGIVRTVLVLLAVMEKEESAEAVGAISTGLFERDGFLSVLHDGEHGAVFQAISDLLRAFYRQKNEEVIGQAADFRQFRESLV